MDTLSYWLWLSNVPGVGPAVFSILLENFKSPEEVFNADQHEIEEVLKHQKIKKPKLSHAILKRKKELDKYRSLAQKYLEQAQKFNTKIICLTDDIYPEFLRGQTSVAPPILYLRGDIKSLSLPGLAVVGTRKSTPHAEKRTYELSKGVAKNEWCVISGLALGIDRIAHEGALDANGKTIAVLGCGVNRVYPSQNKDLFNRILDSGLIVSSYPFGTSPSPDNLRKRNQLTVGLSRAALIAEAPLDSGAMIAARFASQQKKPVFVLRPYDIYSQQAEGVIKLIVSQEAKQVETLSDFGRILDKSKEPALTESFWWSPFPKEKDELQPVLKQMRDSWFEQFQEAGLEVSDQGFDFISRLEALQKIGYIRNYEERCLNRYNAISEMGDTKERDKKWRALLLNISKEINDYIKINQYRAKETVKNKSFDAVIFDVDGVLVNTQEFFQVCYKELLRAHPDFKLDNKTRKELSTKSPNWVVSKYFPEKKDRKLQEFKQIYRKHAAESLKPFEDMIRVLQLLSDEGKKLAVVTSQPKDRTQLALKLFKDYVEFSAVVTWGETVRRKPHPDPLLLALDRLDVKPERAMYIGDTPQDIMAAKDANVYSVAALWGAVHQLDELLIENPDFVVSSPNELIELFKG